MPARIIDPATGASTWAFGSQRCTKYKGVFTIKAKIVKNHQMDINLALEVKKVQLGERKERWKADLYIKSKDSRSGKEAVTVYIIKYVPAWRRSGW